jgi:hypothetical protein
MSKVIAIGKIKTFLFPFVNVTRCGGAVFEAEKLTVKNDVYHKRCFNCRRCSRAMDSLNVMVAPDGDIYCKVRNIISFLNISTELI